jgi:hypothetical protein
VSKQLTSTATGRALAGCAIAAVLVCSTGARAGAGTMSVSVSLAPTVVLHYFSAVHVDIGESSLSAYLYPAGNAVDQGPRSLTSSGATQISLGIAPSAPAGSLTEMSLVLTDAWAVRAIGTGASQTRLTVAVPSPTLANGSARIAIGAARVDAGNGAGGAASIDFAPPGLLSPRIGSIILPLDLSNATRAGVYTGAQVTLTATSL